MSRRDNYSNQQELGYQKSERERVDVGNSIAGGIMLGGAALVIGAGLFLATRYKVSKPEQFLVRTGLGIKDMSISRTGIVWPFQDCLLLLSL